MEMTKGGWNWQPCAEVAYRVSGNDMELSIARSALSLTDAVKEPRIRFKWADNVQTPGDVMDFTVNGDAAPNGRFSYVFP